MKKLKKFSFIQRVRNKIRVKGTLDVNLASDTKIANCVIRSKGKNNKLIIEKGTVIRYTQLELLGDNNTIIIGRNCIIGHGSYLSAKEGQTIEIKDHCSLSRNVKIMTSDGHPIYQDEKIINQGMSITLENNVWVADNVTILKGIHIGAYSVLGINATITKDVPAKSIAAGNPAKVVKENISWEH